MQQKTGYDLKDYKVMLNLVNYIDWALRSGLKLNFDLTEEEMGYVEMAVETPIYQDFGAYPDQVFLPIWQLLQTVEELSQAFSGRIHFGYAKTFHKYATKQKHKLGKTMPKFFLFSGHAEQLNPLLHAL